MLLCTFQTGNNPKMWQSGILPFAPLRLATWDFVPPKGISARRATTPKAMAFEAELDLAKLLFYSTLHCLELAWVGTVLIFEPPRISQVHIPQKPPT